MDELEGRKIMTGEKTASSGRENIGVFFFFFIHHALLVFLLFMMKITKAGSKLLCESVIDGKMDIHSLENK